MTRGRVCFVKGGGSVVRKEGMRGSEEGRGLGSGGAVPLMGEWLHLCVCARVTVEVRWLKREREGETRG